MKVDETKRSKAVSASELAQMGVCERLMVFEHLYGKRPSMAQRKAIKRGLVEHARFYQEGIHAPAMRGRCYIATLILGSGHETMVLRQFRDQVLRPYGAGRWTIAMYYRTAPAICQILNHWPYLQPAVRWVLRLIARTIDCLMEDGEGDHGA